MRLTERSLDYCTQHCPSEKMISCAFYKNDQAERCLIANMYDRLAAYEDTGLEPEEVKEITSWSYGPFHKKMGDWLKAEQEGRLVVLPCKVGTVVWSSELTEIDDDGVEHVATWSFVPGMMDEWGKSFFLTREEAEKALKGE